MRDVRKLIAVAAVICSLVPSAASAIGLEAAVGGWNQDPSGDLSYKGDNLSLENDLKFDNKTKPYGRVKIDMPLLIPNIYLAATPMEFSGTGTKAFTFGGTQFSGSFTSELTLDQYDIGLYYGIPFVQTATLNNLNVDVGINVRIMDFEASITGTELTSGTTTTESKSATIPMPLVYLAAQVTPTDWLAIEAEGRGITYTGNHFYDLIGRVKAKPVGMVFAAVGYRYQDLKIDEEDIKASITFSGPFAEVGIDF